MFGGVDEKYYSGDFTFVNLIEKNPYYSINVKYFY